MNLDDILEQAPRNNLIGNYYFSIGKTKSMVIGSFGKSIRRKTSYIAGS